MTRLLGQGRPAVRLWFQAGRGKTRTTLDVLASEQWVARQCCQKRQRTRLRGSLDGYLCKIPKATQKRNVLCKAHTNPCSLSVAPSVVCKQFVNQLCRQRARIVTASPRVLGGKWRPFCSVPPSSAIRHVAYVEPMRSSVGKADRATFAVAN
jgi:hypothetical protein